MRLPGTVRGWKGLHVNVIATLAKNRIAKNTSILVLAQIASRALGIVYVAALKTFGRNSVPLIRNV